MSARGEDKLKAVAEEIKSAGGEALVVAGDVSKVRQLRSVDDTRGFRVDAVVPGHCYSRLQDMNSQQ